MSKHSKLMNFLSGMPDFVFDYIEIAYNGESINTQIGYSIDIKTFLEYLQKFNFSHIEKIEDFTVADMEKVTLRDLNAFTAYLKEYETDTVSIDGKHIKRIRRNSAYGINRKLSGIRGLFSYLYKNDLISQNVTDKLDFKKLHQKMKRPLTSQETVNLLDVIYNGEKYYTGRDLTEYKNRKKRDIALFTAYLGTGCRVSELINLDIRDVCFDTSSFVVTRKGGDEQEIFMPVQVENELFTYMQERVENEKAMRAIVAERKEKERNSRLEAMLPTHIRNEVVGEGDDGFQHLNLIIKANTNGSAEALSQAIGQFKSNEIIIKLIHVGVGDISEADVMLAAASNAIILGFTVKEDNNAEIAAAREGVTIKKFDIIYQILEDLEKTMLSLLQPEIKEVELGKAEVRQVFTVGKTGRIAGCYVTEGKIFRNKTAKVVRNGEVIFTGTIDQLKRFKDDVKEVATGFECGISFAKFNDIQEGDIIEVSTTEEVERQALV